MLLATLANITSSVVLLAMTAAPIPNWGMVARHELGGDGRMQCDGTIGSVYCPVSSGTCYTGPDGYIGCCEASSCRARTTCFEYGAGTCDTDLGGCIYCSKSGKGKCVTVRNVVAPSQYIMYCSDVASPFARMSYRNPVTTGSTALPADAPDTGTTTIGSPVVRTSPSLPKATSTSTSSPLPTALPPSLPNGNRSGSLHPGVIAGIVIGSVLAILGLYACGYRIWLARHRKKQEKENRFGTLGGAVDPAADRRAIETGNRRAKNQHPLEAQYGIELDDLKDEPAPSTAAPVGTTTSHDDVVSTTYRPASAIPSHDDGFSTHWSPEAFDRHRELPQQELEGSMIDKQPEPVYDVSDIPLNPKPAPTRRYDIENGIVQPRWQPPPEPLRYNPNVPTPTMRHLYESAPWSIENRVNPGVHPPLVQPVSPIQPVQHQRISELSREGERKSELSTQSSAVSPLTTSDRNSDPAVAYANPAEGSSQVGLAITTGPSLSSISGMSARGSFVGYQSAEDALAHGWMDPENRNLADGNREGQEQTSLVPTNRYQHERRAGL